MKRLHAAALVLGLWSCSRGASAPSDATPALAATVCSPTASALGGPVTDPSGPYYHQVVVGQAPTGTAVIAARQVLDHASVPDGVAFSDGSIHVYYVNGAAGAVWVARLEGDSARPLGPIVLNGVSAPAGVVDPDVLRLADGRIRLAFFGGFGPPGASGASLRAMCIAESSDGLRFTTVGPALTYPATELLTDPSEVQLSDGTWLMAISKGQQTVLARSADGRTFTREATLGYGGVPELALLPDGSVRLYVCGAGIVAYRSTDRGVSWMREGVVVGPGFNGHPIVCDPSLVAGTSTFVFKTG